MRIVIDLQACQSSGSRNRGIGRYSLALAQAMVRNAGNHEIFLLVNGLFPETIPALRKQFATVLPAENIRVWHTAGPVNEHDPANEWRCRAGELVREQALAELRPDFVHVTSLFEGSGDNAITSVSALREQLPTAVTLYDLIPLIYQKIYLPHPQVRDWYLRKLQALKNADLSLAISDSSRQEALQWLQIPEENIVNISSAIDDRFHVATYPSEFVGDVLARYDLRRPFVMYTGGIDHRKNIDALIRAFGALPVELRRRYQLAIVCSVNESEREKFLRIADSAGMGRNEVIFTGFVPDEHLPVLYNLCELFVFPSWHEGFGLPALEAMACGAPVIGANTSSLPEVIGLQEAMFNPRSEAEISAKLAQALNDADFRRRLRSHGLAQAKKFTWDSSARLALDAIEACYARKLVSEKVSVSAAMRKRKLAYFTPLPPEQSGIADYSAQLIPELALYYDIDVFVAQSEVTVPRLTANFKIMHWQMFEAKASEYERVLFHFGNSQFHTAMFDLISRHSGVVVLHDFFLSGILSHLDLTREQPGVWDRALYFSHGYHALIARQKAEDLLDVVMQYPCNLPVLDHADGVIVHADYSIQLARYWYGPEATESFVHLPLLRRLPIDKNREETRASLGLTGEDFLVCAFGGLSETKLNHRLLDAWLGSPLAQDSRCHLVFVGAKAGGEYSEALEQTIVRAACSDRIRITGFAEPSLFRAYLSAADASVQLRTMSRGETSAGVLDCMSYGIPTIINAHAAMAELPDDALIKLPDEFSDEMLIEQLIALRTDALLRQSLSRKAVDHIRKVHCPAAVALQYANAIECFAERDPRAKRRRTVSAIARIESSVGPEVDDLQAVACGLSAAYSRTSCKHIWIDVTGHTSEIAPADSRLMALLADPPSGYRVEPVIRIDGGLCFARSFTCELLGVALQGVSDDGVEVRTGDIYVGIELPPESAVTGCLQLDSLDQLEQMIITRNANDPSE